MPSFRHTSEALRIFSGPEALAALPRELNRLGLRRVMIFCGRSLAAQGHLARVEATLGPLRAGSFAQVKAHSPLPDVLRAVEALRAAKADGIIVLGGGSAVITARAASILLGEARPLSEIATKRLPDGRYESPRLTAPKLPLILLPTTPNSAYVKAGAGVFDPEIGERRAIFDPQTRARAIFLDPGLLESAPEALVVGATLDNLFLAAEGLLSGPRDVIAEGELIQSLHLMVRGLSGWAAGERDLRPRNDLTMAGILAGRGTEHATAGACTALGHAIGANFDCDNALTKAVLWPHVLRFNGEHAAPGLARIARALELPRADLAAVSGAFDKLFDGLALPRRLSNFGIAEADLPAIAERAMRDWFMGGNCRPVARAYELLPLLKAAL